MHIIEIKSKEIQIFTLADILADVQEDDLYIAYTETKRIMIMPNFFGKSVLNFTISYEDRDYTITRGIPARNGYHEQPRVVYGWKFIREAHMTIQDMLHNTQLCQLEWQKLI